MATALAYLHGKNIVNRDFKPENVLIRSNDGLQRRSYKAAVTDFGVSKVLQTLTNVGSRAVGTPKYTAPELMEANKPFSELADVFSFGVIMYELFSGLQIFPRYSLPQVMHAIYSDSRPSIPETVPQPIQNVIQKCWKADSTQRPSLGDIKEALRPFLPAEIQAPSPIHESVTMETQAQETSAHMLPIPMAELAWETDESEMAKRLREKMVRNLQELSSFRHVFHRSLLRATGRVPRHKFAESDETLCRLGTHRVRMM